MNFCFRHLSNGMLQRITRLLSVIQTLTGWKILRKAKKSLSKVCFLNECQEYSGFNKVCLKTWLHWLCAKCTMCARISSKIEELLQSAVAVSSVNSSLGHNRYVPLIYHHSVTTASWTFERMMTLILATNQSVMHKWRSMVCISMKNMLRIMNTFLYSKWMYHPTHNCSCWSKLWKSAKTTTALQTIALMEAQDPNRMVHTSIKGIDKFCMMLKGTRWINHCPIIIALVSSNFASWKMFCVTAGLHTVPLGGKLNYCYS